MLVKVVPQLHQNIGFLSLHVSTKVTREVCASMGRTTALHMICVRTYCGYLALFQMVDAEPPYIYGDS